MYKKICITNRKLVEGSFVQRIESILKTDVDVIILREPDLSDNEYEEIAKSVIALCKKYNKLLMLHSHIEVAKRLNWPYIHLRYQAFKDLEDKKFFYMIGVSTHSEEEAIYSEKNGAAYITASHIFETDCKKGLEPRGLTYLENVCNKVNIPVYALGGIKPHNAEMCIKRGAAGICMMSEYMKGNLDYEK